MNKFSEDFLNELQYQNDKKNLIYEMNEWNKNSDFKKEKVLIAHELEKKENLFIHDKKYYRDLIFFSKSENILDEIYLEIVFCNGNKELTDIWKYFKIMSSSAVTGDSSFGCIKIMIKDKNSQKYLGILEIGNDIYTCKCRDDFIGWTSKNKKENVKIDIDDKSKCRLAYIVNITCCIGLQPMSYNLNIGKLLVMTIFSKEVLEYFHNIRGYYYAGVSTFGLYGKSVQYDRLKEIKYIGETKGTGTCDIPIFLYEKIRDFTKKHYPNEYLKRSNMSSSKMRILQFGLNMLDFNQKEILLHGKKRGIYFGYTSSQSKDFFNGKTDTFELSKNISSFNEIVKFWKNRWSKKRFENILKEQRFKIAYELKDFTLNEKKNEYAKQYQYEKMNDTIWLKNKKEKSINYYQNNKDKILEELKIDLENYRDKDKYLYPEYVAGFFDSDGSVYITKDVLFINFSQCVLNVLILIQKQYGGSLFKRIIQKENCRNQYTLRIVGLECKKILEDLEKYCILKIEKIKKALLFIEYINKKTSNEKQEIIDYIRNKDKDDNILYFSRINWKYISGFFDGDGYIGLNYRDLDSSNRISPKFTIAQKYTPNFLNAIKNFFIENKINMGLSKYEIYCSTKDNIIKIYDNIKNYIIVKKFQYENMIKIFEEYQKYIKIRDNEKIKLLAYEIKNNKHENIDYELDIQKNNIVSSMMNNILNNIDKEINNEIHKETYTKMIQSEKKIGLNNPNYGQKLSDNHALKISVATTNAKRAGNPNLTNEKIREIYALKGNEKQIDVAEKYDMNREMIRRIWNRLIIPTDDPEFLTKKQELVSSNKLDNNHEVTLTNEQKTSMGKRTLSSDEYLEIISWKLKKENQELLEGKKIFSTTLSAYLSKLWDKKVSNDMVKNIWCGKTKLFEFEFQDKNISYEKYLEMIGEGDA
jgi:hypothetical protein